MKILKFLFSAFCLLLIGCLFTSCNFPLIKKKKAALQVNSTPKTTVFLNGNHVGQTPFTDEALKPGEYNLKLVPETNAGSFLPWQGIVRLNQGIMTVVKRNLAASEEQSSGYTLALEPTTEKEKVKISVVSTPDSVVVNLDGEPKGFTPLVIENVSEGERLLTISSPGFKKQTIQAKAIKGYKLMINIQLAKEEKEEEKEEEQEATESAKQDFNLKKDKEASGGAEIEKPYVKIKDTPTGWLNVRSEPSTKAKDETVLLQIYPEETYKFIEANETGWYKIEYEKGKQGWISGKYADLVK